MHWIIAHKNICSEIGRKNDQSISEIDLMALTICQEAFIQNLEK